MDGMVYLRYFPFPEHLIITIIVITIISFPDASLQVGGILLPLLLLLLFKKQNKKLVNRVGVIFSHCRGMSLIGHTQNSLAQHLDN